MKPMTKLAAKLNIIKDCNILIRLQYLDFSDDSFFLVLECCSHVVSSGISLRLDMSLRTWAVVSLSL